MWTAAPILYFSTRGTAVQILKVIRFFFISRRFIYLWSATNIRDWLLAYSFAYLNTYVHIKLTAHYCPGTRRSWAPWWPIRATRLPSWTGRGWTTRRRSLRQRILPYIKKIHFVFIGLIDVELIYNQPITSIIRPSLPLFDRQISRNLYNQSLPSLLHVW